VIASLLVLPASALLAEFCVAKFINHRLIFEFVSKHKSSIATNPAGILLAVTIIYQYFETYEKEKAQSASLW